MTDYTRSKSYAYDGSGSNSMQLQPYYGVGVGVGVGQSDLTLRCYSASYAQARADVWGGIDGREGDGEGSNYNKSTSGSRSKAASMSAWGVVADPEFQRKKRVASYKMYAVEGNVKGSFRKSFRWLKDRYSQVVHGW